MKLNISRDDWIPQRLGDFVISAKGKKPKNQSEMQTEIYKYPYVDIQGFEKNIFDSYTDGQSCTFCTEDDFLMVWDGSRSGLVGKAVNGAIGSTLVKINLPKIENRFAYYFLKSKYIELNTNAKGTGTPHVNPDLLWNYSFPIVPILEQKAIVAKIEQLFSELDKGIESLKTAQAKLKIYRQAVLNKAFEGELTKEWREKQTNLPTAEELLEAIKQEREVHYQQQLDEWKRSFQSGHQIIKPKKIKEYKASIDDSNKLNINLGAVIEEPKYGTSKKCDYTVRGMGVLRIPNISDGFIDSKDLKFALFTAEEALPYQLKRGDILIIRSNGSVKLVGKTALISEFDENYLYAGYLIRLRPYEKIAVSKYLHYLLSSHELRKQIEKKAKSTSGVNNINSGELESLIIPITTIEEQNQIVQEIESRLSLCDKIEQTISDALVKAEALRQSILKKAFEGKLLHVKELEAIKSHPEYESAEKLLQRIKLERAK